ncbi:diguanylate cyclase (GGDEF) domain-containing protein [Xenococcus sp. PCC 7305]|uniref:EAL domain-containing protein n=1 Tax=Xenococcus sp. PCC 7305 TaxID=102125 RepID=UPI0002ACFF4F|nr:EAL domain-containing protein [Xenococcus sp. PCC 7305]ELS04316.1 diguanylate cyclase (GGDEF) domain-containing protein [Xenococcus sp. PCC 7305]
MVISIDSKTKELILIVGNDDETTNFLFQSLTNSGYQVLLTQNLESITAKSVCPDLVLLDIPEAQEYDVEVSDYLENNLGIESAIPTIYLIPYFRTLQQMENWQLNTADYLFKPINQQALITRIEGCLRLKRLEHSLARQEEESKILFKLSENILQSLDLEVTLQKIVEDIQKNLNCDRAIISSYTRNYHSFTVQALGIESPPIIPGIYGDFLSKNYAQDYDQYSVKSQQYQQGNIQLTEDINNCDLESSEQAYLKDLGIKSQLVIPIFLQKTNLELGTARNDRDPNSYTFQENLASDMSSNLWGWLIIHQCNSSKTWQQPEINFLQHLVSQIAIAIRQGLQQEQLQQQNQHLQELELYDPLTEVYNRRYLDQQLSLEWRRLKRNPSPISMIICDVDYFEAYKDIYGKQAGEKCLQQVAQVIAQAIRRPADFVSLYSTEKFAIILPHTPVQGAQKIVQAIQAKVTNLQLPHVKSSVGSLVTLSFGIVSTIPNASESPSLMMKAAEQALYLAKSRGRNCYTTYNEEISQLKLQPQQELTWSKRLHSALEKNLFRLYAQSIEPLDNQDQRQHFEILLRLQEQDDVIISPNDFLPVANRFSMMPQIDSWVIDNLFSQLANSKAQNYQKFVFTINLSGASLNDDIFLDFLQAKIIEYHLDPKLFCFEITESVAINNIAKVSNFIKILKQLGCSFALDDFGTGMSSLSYLKELPVDYLKIDGSFIREINNDSITKSMVIAINNLAQIIGLKTIAEFVEDQSILRTLKDLNVDYAQGFYLSKPCLLNNIIS